MSVHATSTKFTRAKRPGAAHAFRGFSLIELMIGLLISLIGTLAMLYSFAAFEGQKRTTTSGSDAQQAGSFSLFNLERQIRTAGSGFVQGKNHGVWGCPINAYSSSTQRMPSGGLPAPFATSGLPTTLRAIPVLVASGGVDGSGNALPDAIEVMGGNPAARTFRAVVVMPPPGGSSIVLQKSSYPDSFGVYANDYLLGASDQAFPYVPNACPMVRAAAVDNTTGTITLSAPDGPPSGFVGAFAAGNVNVFDLGPAPAFNLFGVDPNSETLVTFDLLQRNAAVAAAPVIPVADGIVELKALYGVDDGAGGGIANDDIIDEWVAPAGPIWGVAALTAGTAAAATSISQIKAVRIAVVSRSQLPERASDYTSPYSSTNPLTLFTDQPAALQFKVSTASQYRYKVYDTTIPVRNWSITSYY